jgi:hypothetical protein
MNIRIPPRRSCPPLFFFLLLVSPVASAAPAPLTGDTFINAQPGQANNSFGSRALIKVSPEHPKQGLLQFNLAGIEGNVTSAVLTFSVARVISPGSVGLHSVLSSWNENSVTFNSAPGFNPAPLNSTSIAPDDAGGTISVDVSSAAQAWITDPDSNHGLALLSQGANVEIFSKEGGGGATLEVITGDSGAPDNTVVVAPAGGDYTNPLDAVDNALEGDQWCSSSCVIIVQAGEYVINRTLDLIPDGEPENFIILKGAGSNTTTIRSTSDVGTAIIGADVSSLTIVHTAPFTGEKIGWTTAPLLHPGLIGNDVRISVNGGTVNYGVRTGGELNTPALSDVWISISGGTDSAGIIGTEADLHNVEILATGDRVRGIVNFGLDSAGLSMENSNVRATGDFARAVVAAGAGAFIADSLILASGNSSSGLEISGFSDRAFQVFSSTVRGSGSGSSGVSITNEGSAPVAIARSKIDGETAVMVGGTLLEILDSTLDGSQTALALLNSGVRIDNSVLVAPVSIAAQSISDVKIGATKLDGAINPGSASFTCVYVYDGDYAALDSSCQ